MTEERGEPCIELDKTKATPLPSNDAKSSFSQGFLKMLASAAGAPVSFTPQDQDFNAIDAQLTFAEAPIPVQLKCTSTLKPSDAGLRFPLKEAWIRSWRRSLLPVYLVVVVLSRESEWIRHEESTTIANAKAFWARVDQLELGTPSILMSHDHTLDDGTIDTWIDALKEGGLA